MKIKYELSDHGKYTTIIDYDYNILLDNDIMLYFKYNSEKRSRLPIKKAIENIKYSPYEILDVLHKNELDIKLIEYTDIYKTYIIDDYKKINRYNKDKKHNVYIL